MQSADEDSDYYVYLHCRRDNGLPFYIGKGKWNRARQTTNRGKDWHSTRLEAGGFTVSFVAKGLTDSAAKALEWQKIAELRDLVVNAHKGPSLVSKRRRKLMVTLTIDAALLGQLKSWTAAQNPKRPFNGVMEQAITEYLDAMGG